MNWKRTLWKATKTATVSAASIAATAFASALLNRVDTAGELQQLGLPLVWVPIALGAVTALRSWWKRRWIDRLVFDDVVTPETRQRIDQARRSSQG